MIVAEFAMPGLKAKGLPEHHRHDHGGGELVLTGLGSARYCIRRFSTFVH
jgi:hypothetical protein